MPISLHVWGDYACFTRPELKAERVSYEVMTPSAARGILSAIYWKPQFRWVIDRIHVLNPIRFTQVRRNELGCRMTNPNGIYIDETDKDGKLKNRQQRAATILRDVAYVIDAHIEITEHTEGVDDVGKHLSIFERRSAAGQCFHQPCFGTREFPAMFALVDADHPAPECSLPPPQRNRSFGLMLHDMVYQDDPNGPIICAHTKKKQTATPHFFMAELQNGVLHVPSLSQTLS